MNHVRINRRTCLRLSAAGVAIAFAAPALRAQSPWPSRPVHMVVPFPAGGIVDNVTRALLPKLTAALGQPIVVDNKAGAGGSIGAGYVATAKDDHNLLMAFDTYTVNPLLYKLGFDPEKDLKPVALVGTSPLVVVTPKDSPIHSIQDLVAQAKSRPGALNYASTGAGSSNQLAAEMFAMATGVSFTHIPYKGGAPAITDVLGGRVDVMFVSAPSVLAHIKAGRMKALAVTTRERIPQLPGVPTVAESYPGFEVQSWVGLLAPAQLSNDIVRRLNADVHAAASAPEVKALFDTQALRLSQGSPEDFAHFLHEERERWAVVIRKANIKVD